MPYFLEREKALERGIRLIDSVQRGELERVVGEEVVIEGRAVVEAMYGVGHDLICDGVYVRVHTAMLQKITVPTPCASVQVRIFGTVLNIHLPMRVIVVSVKEMDYDVIGTT